MIYSRILYIKKKTFTLIEMLIVIVIIGILAAALIPRMRDVQGRARDSQRKVDLRTLFNANEIFKTDNGRYAQGGGCAYNVNCHIYSSSGSNWFFNFTGILNSPPMDPINTAVNGFFTGGAYVYTYSNVYFAGMGINTQGIDTYDLRALLENTKDPDRCEVKQYFNSAGIICSIAGSGDWSKYHIQMSPHTISKFN